MIRKVLFVFFFLIAILAAVWADQSENVEPKTVLDMARRRRHRYRHWWPMIGLYAVKTWVAIKFKLLLIFIGFMGIVFYGYKLYSGNSCSSGPFDLISRSGIGFDSPIVSDVDPYSAYSSHHDFHHDDFHHDDFHHDSSQISPSGPPAGAEVAGADVGGGDVGADTSAHPYYNQNSASAPGVTYARSLNNTNSGFDWSEMAFSFLDIESTDCRKRFLCEMNLQYTNNPVMGMAYNLITRQVFSEYQKEIEQNPAKSLKHCAAIYKGCHWENNLPKEDENSDSVNSVSDDDDASRSFTDDDFSENDNDQTNGAEQEQK